MFNIDIETCQACGGPVRIIVEASHRSIEDPVVIKKILDHPAFAGSASPLGSIKDHYDYLLNKPAYAAVVNTLNSRSEFAAPAIQSDPNEPILVSHRGNTGISPAPNENSKAAIRAAIDAGFEWVEIDLQISSDGIPTLNHDETVSIKGHAVPIWVFRARMFDPLRRVSAPSANASYPTG